MKTASPLSRLLLALSLTLLAAGPALANATAQTLPFSQNWSNAALITANDDWSAVPGIEGFRGDGLAGGTAVDPQTILAADDPGVIDVNANQTNPSVFNTGGPAEFAITDPTVALAGSGTARGPHLRFYLQTTGQSNVTVHYNLRDIDGSTDNSLQQVALHFRAGVSGAWTNVAAAYVADASGGPSTATLVTPVCVVLPAAADNLPILELRVMTSDAAGNDEFIGIDDILVDTAGCGAPTSNLTVTDVSQIEGDSGTTNFSFNVNLSASVGTAVTFDIATADGTATVADNDYAANSVIGASIPSGSTSYNFQVTVNGDTTAEANQTFFVNVTNVTGAGVTVADSQGQGTIVNDDVTLTPIHDIQGPGSSSPIVGSSVTTRGVVTGVRANGFFIQEPDATVDADPATSEGVFVFTSVTPPAAAVVGNLVQVTATVSEFVPTQDVLQPPLTELVSPSVNQVSAGNPMPAAVTLTAAFPSPSGSFDQLERLEGMRVTVPSLTVVGPTLGSINEPNATATSQGVLFAEVTGLPRAFREAGIQAPDPPPAGSGSIPPIPRFDTNPEVIRIDSDSLNGTTAIDAPLGALILGATGPLDYTFRHYTIVPETSLSFTGGVSAVAVATPTASEFTVGAYNLQRFFDTVNDPAIGEPILTTTAFNNRLAKASLGIRNFLKYPDIIGIVEMENLSTLQALAAQISSDAIAAGDPDPLYQAFLSEGNDIGGIDVGFLVQQRIVFGSTPRVTVVSVVQENKNELFVNPDSSTALLNDRPPLVLSAVVNHPNGASFPLVVIVNHLRSLGSVNDETAGSNGWATEGARVRAKRHQQAVSLANLIQARQVADPNERLVILGDFNAFEVNDGYGHSMGTIQGTPVPDNETAVAGDGADLVNPDITNLFDTPPAAERYSYVFDGNAQSLDHLLVSSDLISATLARRIEHPRINADFPEVAKNNTSSVLRLADHDPVVGFFQVAGFASADLSITKTDSPDPVAAGGNITYTITVTNNGPDSASTASWSDTLPAGTTFVSLPAVAGWSCSTPAVGAAGTVTCSNGTFALGSSVFTLTVAVAPATAAGTVISNTAAVTAATGDPTSANNSATATTTVSGSADLSITKTDTPDPVTAGNNLTYIVTVTNAGPSSAATVAWTDTLPAGTTFVSIAAPPGWSCTTPAIGSGGLVTCSAASLAAGNAAFSMIVNVDASVATGTVISNTATVSAATADPVPGNNSATTTTTVGTSADLSVTKTDSPDPVAAGANLTYTITVTSAGPSNAATVALADTLPAGTTFVSLASPGGWSCTTPAVGAGGTVNCSNASLAPAGSAVFTLVVAVPVSATGTITNTAALTTATTDPVPANNSATATTGVVPAADLSISKTGTSPATAGASFSYTVTVQNAGPGAATAASWSDTLPANTTFVSLTSLGGWSCTTPAVGAGGTVTCSNASFAVGSAAFTLVVAVDSSTAAGATIANTATATATSADPDSGDLSSTATVSVIAPATLSGTKAVGGSTAPGGTVLYHLVLSNAGPADQADLAGDELVDVLPPELILVNATASSGTILINVATNTVTWNGAVAVGDTVEIDIEATLDPAAPDGASVSNQASLRWDGDGDGTSEATGSTDDPAQGGGADPTVFVVGGAEPVVDVPVLDHRGLLALVALIAAVAVFRLRR